jgi:hypothetical protein
MAIVCFPDGTRVRASSIATGVEDPERTFGHYLDTHWQPTWPAAMVDWKDFGLPENRELAARQIVEAFGRAQHGGLVEVGCLGGTLRSSGSVTSFKMRQ